MEYENNWRKQSRVIKSYLVSDFVFSFELEAFGKDGWDDKVINYWASFGNVVSEQDGSIKGAGVVNPNELKPTPMNATPANFKALLDFLDLLPTFGAKTNNSCGFHIHVSFPNFDEATAAWILCNFAMDTEAQDMFLTLQKVKFYTEDGKGSSYASKSFLKPLAGAIIDVDKALRTSGKDEIPWRAWHNLSTHLSDEKSRVIRLHPIGTLEWRGPRNFLNKHNISLNKAFVKLLWHYLYWINNVLEKRDTIIGTSIRRDVFGQYVNPKYMIDYSGDSVNKKIDPKKIDPNKRTFDERNTKKDKKTLNEMRKYFEGVMPKELLNSLSDEKTMQRFIKALEKYRVIKGKLPVTKKDWGGVSEFINK